MIQPDMRRHDQDAQGCYEEESVRLGEVEANCIGADRLDANMGLRRSARPVGKSGSVPPESFIDERRGRAPALRLEAEDHVRGGHRLSISECDEGANEYVNGGCIRRDWCSEDRIAGASPARGICGIWEQIAVRIGSEQRVKVERSYHITFILLVRSRTPGSHVRHVCLRTDHEILPLRT